MSEVSLSFAKRLHGGLLAAIAGATMVLGSATAADADSFAYSGQVDGYTAPVSGYYQIEAAGAQGAGIIGGFGTANNLGGLGAEVGGGVYLQAGESLSIVVGGVGNGGGNLANGGGGASWVFITSDQTLLLAAGGGGGAGWNFCCSGGPGLAGPDGAAGGGTGGGGGGGTAGGGGGYNAGSDLGSGGGGAGWLGAGEGSGTAGARAFPTGTGGTSLPSFQGGMTLGCVPYNFPLECYDLTTGGFGGGGGAGWDGGGGGGGYSGGGGGNGDGTGGGGGGGSYIADGFSNIVALSGVNAGFGFVTINLAAVPEPSTWVSMLVGIGLLGAALRRRRARPAAA